MNKDNNYINFLDNKQYFFAFLKDKINWYLAEKYKYSGLICQLFQHPYFYAYQKSTFWGLIKLLGGFLKGLHLITVIENNL